MRPYRRVLACVLAAALTTLALADAALAQPPLQRAYGCYGNANGNLNYVGSFELISPSVYLWAADQNGSHLKGQIHRATYHAAGNRVRFLTGPYKAYLGLYTPKSAAAGAHINLYQPDYHTWTGISCELS